MSQLQEKLDELGMTIEAEPTGYVSKTADPDGWEHFGWNVTLRFEGRLFKTTFRTGVAHVRKPSPLPRRQRSGHLSPCGPRWETDRSIQGIAERQAWYSDKRNHIPPKTADVVSCLIHDSVAGSHSSFEDFCAEFGYCTDSRKAEKLHLACAKIAAQFYPFLGKHFADLADLEH